MTHAHVGLLLLATAPAALGAYAWHVVGYFTGRYDR